MSDSRTSGLPFRLAHVVAVFAALALGACEGPRGQQGEQGEQGLPGQNGQDGAAAVDHGTISGKLTVGTTATAAGGVSVVASPGDIAATTDANGDYSLQVPIGLYTVTFGADPADGFEKVEVANVAVTAGATAQIDKGLARTNPLVLKATTQYQVGFDKSVTLGVTVTGVPSGSTATYAWTQTGGMTVALSDAAAAAPTFTTKKFSDILAVPGKTDIAIPLRHQIMPIASQQIKQMNYTFKVTVTAGVYSASTAVEVQSLSNYGGMGVVPKGMRIMLGTPAAASYAWTVTGGPVAATVDQANEQFATVIFPETGTYTITEGAWSKTVTVGTYLSANTCKNCHTNNTTFPRINVYNEWAASGHANLFKLGVNGVASDHYSGSCIRCHTTGYDPGADNGGFDDVARANNWTFPAHPAAGTFDTLPAALQNLGAIACENCHGPGSEHASSMDKAKTSVNMSAGTCMACHYEAGHHDRGFLWKASPTGHANLQLAMDEATNASCGRCHGAQGFKIYAANLLQGIPGNITIPPTLTSATAEPQTCQACHDPHTLEVRLEGSIQMLPNGFGVAGVGRGALCMACHNTRNGLHDDAHVVADLRAPHSPSQTDVFMGRNAYFTNGINISSHAAAADTCATCHVGINPTGLSVLPAGYVIPGTNHTFKANSSICASCHSANVTGEALEAAIEQGIDDLSDTAGRLAFKLLKAQIDGTNASFTVTQLTNVDDPAEPTATAAVTIDAAHFPADSSSFSFLPEIHGRQSLCMTLPAPVQVTWSGTTTPVDVTHACFQLEKAVVQGTTTQVVAGGSTLGKSLWNYYLLHGDGSAGIHNPSYVREVIDNTIVALNAAIAAP